jgi:hypothetical protein
MHGSGGDLFCDTIPIFHWRDCRKTRKPTNVDSHPTSRIQVRNVTLLGATMFSVSEELLPPSSEYNDITSNIRCLENTVSSFRFTLCYMTNPADRESLNYLIVIRLYSYVIPISMRIHTYKIILFIESNLRNV